MRVEKPPGTEYESPVTKLVQDTTFPDCETFARLGIPGSGTDFTGLPSRLTSAEYVGPGPESLRHTLVPPAA